MRAEDIPIPLTGSEEVVVGRHESGIILQEGLNTSTASNYCQKCNRNIHCFVKVDRDTKEAKIHKTCTNDSCECKCRTHYACRQCGYLHPYGDECDRISLEYKITPEDEKKFNETLSEWREYQKSKQHNIPKVKRK